MRLSELQNKDVINIIDGKRIGNIIDAKIEVDGTLSGLIVEKSRFFLSFFTSRNEIEIGWKQIEK